MGYCYDMKGRLACDKCGNVGGVRKRKCPHKVIYPPELGGGSLPYCYPAALCGPCYTAIGGAKVVHAGCKEAAAAANVKYAAKAAKLAAGDLMVKTCFSDYHDPAIPKGYLGVLFEGVEPFGERWGLTSFAKKRVYKLVPEDEYLKTGEFLSDHPSALPYDGPPGAPTTKCLNPVAGETPLSGATPADLEAIAASRGGL